MGKGIRQKIEKKLTNGMLMISDDDGGDGSRSKVVLSLADTMGGS